MIMATGIIRTNKAGVVYLADELYSTGAEAASLLGIPVVGPAPTGVVELTKPVDVTCVIPIGRLDLRVEIDGPERADQFRDWATGDVIHLGGGSQFKYYGPIDVKTLSWMALGSP